MMKKAGWISCILLLCFLPGTAFAQIAVSPSPFANPMPWWHPWSPCNPSNPNEYARMWPCNPYNPNNLATLYGQVIRYIEVPPQQVEIQVYVPGPGSFSGGYEQQVVEIPGYVVTETTTGYIYPERVGLQQVTLGVHQWVTLPQQFQPK